MRYDYDHRCDSCRIMQYGACAGRLRVGFIEGVGPRDRPRPVAGRDGQAGAGPAGAQAGLPVAAGRV